MRIAQIYLDVNKPSFVTATTWPLSLSLLLSFVVFTASPRSYTRADGYVHENIHTQWHAYVFSSVCV